VGAVPLLALIHLVVVAVLTRHWPWEVWPVRLEQLGSYGDSIAPWTAGFAMLAALFAGLAFREQRDALEVERETARQERAHANLARFDALAAQALTMYDDALVRLDQSAHKADKNRSGQSLLRNLQRQRLRGEIHPSRDATAYHWTHQLNASENQPVQRFARTVFAIIVWLDDVAQATDLGQHTSTARWVRLLEARMSEAERHMLMELIEFTASPDVKTAEGHLRIFNWSELNAYTKSVETDDGRKLRTVKTELLSVAPELLPRFDSLSQQGLDFHLEADDSAPIVVRRDGSKLWVVAGLMSYLYRTASPQVNVLMDEDASGDDYTHEEKSLLIQTDRRPASVRTKTLVLGLDSHTSKAIESIWHFENAIDGRFFSQGDILIFLESGFEPDANTLKNHPNVFFHTPVNNKVVNCRAVSFPFLGLAWHQLSDDYAEYSDVDLSTRKPKRSRAFRYRPEGQ
jgi:hypothetical protein